MTTGPIKLKFRPDDLLTALAVVERFRATDESRPILESVHVRPEPGAEGTRVEFTATDSYHLVRVSVELAAPPRPRLPAEGAMLRLRSADVRRVHRAIVKAERTAGRSLKAPPPPTLLGMTLAGTDADSAFGLTPAGSWNGGGVFVAAVGPLEGEVDVIATGNRVGPTRAHGVEEPVYRYPDVDKLLADLAPPGTVNLDQRVGLEPRYLADIGDAAAVFAAHVEPGAAWRHCLVLEGASSPLGAIRFSVKVDPDCRTRFLAILMPIRLDVAR